MYTTDIIQTEVASGSSFGSSGLTTLEAGCIKGISVFTNNVDNDGIIRCRVTDVSGRELVKSQPIEMLRNRETSFHEGFYPITLEGGKSYKCDIIASENFADDFQADFVFIYE
jgi:hypothetical protein